MKYALWLLASVLPTLAIAETTIYGEIKAGLSTSHQSTSPVKYGASTMPSPFLNRNTQTQVEDNGSFVGLRGQEQIGDSGVKAIWQIEQDTPVGHARRRD